MEDKIKEVLEFINPYLNSDGGNIEFIKYVDNILYVKISGTCAFCDLKDSTINDFILRNVQEEVPEVKDIVNVDL